MRTYPAFALKQNIYKFVSAYTYTLKLLFQPHYGGGKPENLRQLSMAPASEIKSFDGEFDFEHWL